MELQLGWHLLAAVGLVVVGALHVAWGLGSPWPAPSPEVLARAVVGGMPGGLPGLGPCLGVAALLFLGALLVVWAPQGPGLARLGAGLVAATLLARGLAGFFMPALSPAFRVQPFHRWNAWLYSPLCVLLGLGALLSLR
ncbi:DUF3995 domain-containing protein [Deinococcus multiflagellatus]|uniref:DUF3995 domain-containing protein n=1 Tax=Deinococcus multiflagellatus TaxID=1656887 RepID=A0ABW1ZP79_9DEIO|nr:DUF3995 domain-containing protein [Deinococcus multiflagellatus]MBZ9714008.1 DUF3995 domain-containing protein [Deinococcus multiflagellatus]